MKYYMEVFSLPAAFLAVCTFILMIPMHDESWPVSIVCGAFTALCAFALPLCGIPSKMVCGTVMLTLGVYLVVRNRFRFRMECRSNLRLSKATRIRTEARAFYSCACFLCGLLYICLLPEVEEWILDIPAGALVMPLAVRAVTGRNLFIPVRPRRRSAVVEGMNSREEVYKIIYEKAVACMEQKKPYANTRLKEEELARMIGVSRTELSRAISLHTSDNFNQFVNGYRVPDAVQLMSRDPYMKVTEAGRLSGFQSESSFTSVFKQYTGRTPSEFMRHVRYERRKSL